MASHATSKARTPTPSVAYPHRRTIETALGTNIPGHWQVDEEACSRLGTPSFTQGALTTFATEEPPLHVAAHEAAHLLQHAGRTRDGGLGAEGHANAVANAVAEGTTPGHLIGKSHGSPVPARTRLYTQFTAFKDESLWEGKPGRKTNSVSATGGSLSSLEYPVRVSDTHETLTNSTGTRRSHILYATEAIVKKANATFAAQSGGVSFVTNSNDSIEIAGKHLVSVSPIFTLNPDTPCLARNCNEAAQNIMGPDQPAPVVRYAGTNETNAEAFTLDKHRDEILEAGGLGSDALDSYRGMSEPDAEKLDRWAGINRHALPNVGEAYVIDPAPDHRKRWNFHWAAVVMAPGNDRVTLENSAMSEQADPNEVWEFQTYGSAAKPSQTFHEHYAEGNSFAGTRSEGTMTMVARHPNFRDLGTQEVIRRYNDPNKDWGYWPWTEMAHRRFKVEITFYKFRGWWAGDTERVSLQLKGAKGETDTWGPFPVKTGEYLTRKYRLRDFIARGQKPMTVLLEQVNGDNLAYFDWEYHDVSAPYPFTEIDNEYCNFKIQMVDQRE
jgi:hypothetical protein